MRCATLDNAHIDLQIGHCGVLIVIVNSRGAFASFIFNLLLLFGLLVALRISPTAHDGAAK